MGKRIRSAAAWLALSAMLLRALVPAGWMPAASGGAFLVLCTANGLVQVLDAQPDSATGGSPASHLPAADGTCPFGATAVPALPGAPAPVADFAMHHEAPAPGSRPAFAGFPPTGSHAPRAPPLPPVA